MLTHRRRRGGRQNLPSHDVHSNQVAQQGFVLHHDPLCQPVPTCSNHVRMRGWGCLTVKPNIYQRPNQNAAVENGSYAEPEKTQCSSTCSNFQDTARSLEQTHAVILYTAEHKKTHAPDLD